MGNINSHARILIQIGVKKRGEKVNMSDKEKIISALHLINGKKENVEKIAESIGKFFEGLHLEIEDWKFSMEEFNEGTRIFFRFQIIVKR
jgi:hypothetical protein